MKKITKLSRAAILVAVSFGINKLVAILRQLIIARQFGLSADLDVFNVANNIPDLLYSLISGGALAVAIIPVMTEVMNKKNREASWRVFSQIANIAFMTTLLLSLLVAIFAWPLVQHPLGIAPGFDATQQALVVRLMRLNLLGTVIFSMAGLLIAGLQANQHFLLPAIGPVLYNAGQIFGAVILSPEQGYSFGSFTLPALGMGIDGLVYGVLIGSFLYFIIQIPGLVKYQFKWAPGLHFRDPDVKKILIMLGPRLISMLFYQLTFIARDNLASHLPLGSVTALTYGWMILQVPETLIGTAIGTALLPTLSAQIANDEREQFDQTIRNVSRVLFAFALPSAIVLSVVLQPFLAFAFGFDAVGTQLMMATTRAFLAGLLGHVFIELGARIFFAQQNAKIPLFGAIINLVLFVAVGITMDGLLGVPGIALADAIAFSAQAIFLMLFYHLSKNRTATTGQSETAQKVFWRPEKEQRSTFLRALAGSAIGAGIALLVGILLPDGFNALVSGTAAAVAGMIAVVPFILKELQLLFRL
jgi:putative peptidoglycan lipid II flippase